MRIAVDTNLAIYVEQGVAAEADAPKMAVARRIVRNLEPDLTILPAQVLGELFGVLVRRFGLTREAARATTRKWARNFQVQPTFDTTLDVATYLATAHRFSIWDGIVVASAVEAGCAVLLSEDMQDGFWFQGVEIVNPFNERPPEWLAALADT